MQRALTLLSVATLCLGVAACSKNSNGSSPKKSADQPQAAEAAWTMTMTSNCGQDVAKEECVAGAGFSVDADGVYTLGSKEQGKVYKGRVDADEIKKLEELAGLQLGANAGINPIAPLGSATERSSELQEISTTDKLTLKQKSADVKSLLRTEPAKLFYPSSATEDEKIALDAQRYQDLYFAVRALANRYYLVPFPNPCADAGAALADLFAPFQSCAVDTDCSYVDSDFAPVAQDQGAWVETENCSFIPLLVAGNAKALNADAVSKLIKERDRAQELCSATPTRNDTCSFSGFAASERGPAVCVNRVCQVRPVSAPPAPATPATPANPAPANPADPSAPANPAPVEPAPPVTPPPPTAH